MSEVSKTIERGPVRWGVDLAFAAFTGLWEALRHGAASGSTPGAQIMMPAAAGLVVAVFAFGLLLSSRVVLDGPDVWVFDTDGYRHVREAWLWPTRQSVAYADVARIQIRRSVRRPPRHVLTLVLRSGKIMRVGATWDETELVAIRDLLSGVLPGSDLPD